MAYRLPVSMHRLLDRSLPFGKDGFYLMDTEGEVTEERADPIIQRAVKTVQTAKSDRAETYIHAIIVMTIVLSSVALRVADRLDVATLSTVFGAALGYATGLTVKKGGS